MDLNMLMQAAQKAGIDPGQISGAMGGGGGMGAPGGGGMGGAPAPSGGADMAQQLMQIAQKVMSTPKGMQMVQAIAGALGQGNPPGAAPTARGGMGGGPEMQGGGQRAFEGPYGTRGQNYVGAMRNRYGRSSPGEQSDMDSEAAGWRPQDAYDRVQPNLGGAQLRDRVEQGLSAPPLDPADRDQDYPVDLPPGLDEKIYQNRMNQYGYTGIGVGKMDPPNPMGMDSRGADMPGQQNMGAYLNANNPNWRAPLYPTRPDRANPGMTQWQHPMRGEPTPEDLQYMNSHPTDQVLEDFERYYNQTPQVGGPYPVGPTSIPRGKGKKRSTEEELDQTQKNMGKKKKNGMNDDDADD
jgi:hypothetical protein